ncbi:MAG: CHC2 zinc finger domain-containing protein [Anaerolineae bacterium]
MPLGIHRKTGDRYPFVGLGDWRSQLESLSHPDTVPLSDVMQYQYVEPPHPRAPRPINGELPVWEKIKQRLPIGDVVAKYVELDSKGRGRCPFHDDQHPSLSVNFDEGYWHCFAGCGGGSVIDFWMKLHSMSFAEAVSDLAAKMNIE